MKLKLLQEKLYICRISFHYYIVIKNMEARQKDNEGNWD